MATKNNKKMAENKKNNAANAAAKQPTADSSAQEWLDGFERHYNELAQGTRRKPINVHVDRTVGNNGYSLKQSFTLTGAIEVVDIKDGDGKVTGCYLGLPTEEGPKLSLAALMGVSTLRGYLLEGSVTEKRAGVEPEQLRTFTADTSDEAKKPTFKCWALKDRNIYALAKQIKSDPLMLKGKKATFHGIALRTINRRQDTEDFDGIMWHVGDVSVIQQRLWSVA
jgi:hypothetical protein